MNYTIVITGASSGFGALAAYFAALKGLTSIVPPDAEVSTVADAIV